MTGCRVRAAGDSALLLELEAVVDPMVNAKAIGIADAIAHASMPGILGVRATYRSVAVYFDPLMVSADAVRAAFERASALPVPSIEGRLIEVPVAYGGEHGPDLDDVAAFGGLSAGQVVTRHAGVEYRVYMLGFLPGFAYMATVDQAIAAPRRTTPRVRVPGGSVGIAESQTGVYPFASPGGWSIIGRTPLRVFDPDRGQPALFAPGDRVRFVPSDGRLEPDTASDPPAVSGVSRITARDAAVTVLEPGLLTTIQDEGRPGHQALGVPVSGAMDLVSHRLANALVGNDRHAAALEVTLAGPVLRLDVPASMAIAGADLTATLDGVPIAAGTAVPCPAGSVLRFGRRRTGGRAYVAFDGGIAVPPVLGSRATHTRSRLGGLEGRALRAGDRLPLGTPVPLPPCRTVPTAPQAADTTLRVLPGPQDDFFPPAGIEVLTTTRFRVGSPSDRMGYRLESGRPIPSVPDRPMISDATFTGAIQVPPSGQPILLMSDRQTTGGYPQIAVVITADLPRAGQLVPGDWVAFAVCTQAEALAALADREERLGRIG